MNLTPEPTGAAFPTVARTGRGIRWLWRKTWRYSLALLALLIAAHIGLNIYAGRLLEAELAKIRARGEPLTWREAAPPPVPDSENAAVLYQQAFAALKRDPDYDSDRFALYPKPPRQGQPPTLRQVEAFVALHQPEFRLLEEASLRPRCRFPVNWGAGANALFPHLARVREATRFLTVKALADAQAGNAAAAMNDLAIAIRMSEQISSEPSLIAQLVRAACIAIVSKQFPKVMAASPPTAAQSRALYDLLGNQEIRGAFVRAMYGERAVFGMWVFDYMRRASPKDSLLVLGIRDPPAWVRLAGFVRPAVRVAWEPFLKLDEVRYLRYMERTINAFKLPYLKARSEYRASYQQLERGRWYKPWYSILIVPVYSRASQKADETIARLGLMQAALALRAYQIEHGGYPASLEGLQKAGGWAIPDDPLTGKPFIYRREGQGYLVYSVGQDLQDNGGIDYEAASRPRRSQGSGYDIPIRMPR